MVVVTGELKSEIDVTQRLVRFGDMRDRLTS